MYELQYLMMGLAKKCSVLTAPSQSCTKVIASVINVICCSASYFFITIRERVMCFTVTTCRENLEMSGNLTAVREMSGILLQVREYHGKNLSGKSCLKLFIVSYIFVPIQVFSRSLFCVKY